MADPRGKGSRRERLLSPFQSGYDKLVNFAKSPSRPSSPLPGSSVAQSAPSPAFTGTPDSRDPTNSVKVQGKNATGTSARPTKAGAGPAPDTDYIAPVTTSGTETTEMLTGAGRAALSGLGAALQMLAKRAEALPPIQQALGRFITCLDIIQSVTERGEEYEQLTAEFTTLANTLSQYMVELGPEASGGIVGRIAQSVELEVTRINARQNRSMGRQIIETVEDKEDVIKSYRRIEALFRELQSDIDLRTWRNTNKLPLQYATTLLKGMEPVDDAMYNSSYSTTIKRRGCTADTRQKVQADIQHWIQDPNGAKVYWMNGMAGTGKTTIAYSVCEWLKANKLLGASFFCSRVSSACRNVNLIVPTIAYQLSLVSQPFRLALCKVLETDPSISKQNVVQQFDMLIQKPWMTNENPHAGGLVVVVDALDECEDEYGVQLVLGTLLKSVAGLPLKFLITSRPEPAIQENMLSSTAYSPTTLHLHDIEQSVVKEDIKKYLTESLSAISLSPSIDAIERLATLAGNLFIYAATTVRYIASGRGFALARLNSMLTLELHPAGNRSQSKRYEELDELYRVVLAAALDDKKLEAEEMEAMQTVLWTVVCAKEPMTVPTLALFINLTEDQVRAALDPLHSVVHVSEDRKLVSTLHASFPDYILDRHSSKDYFCDQRKHSQLLTNQCFDIMNERLKFNICNLNSSFTFDKDVYDLEQKIAAFVPPVLFYACQHWGNHLRLVGTLPADELHQKLKNLLDVRLLFWMEVMNLKQCIVQGISVLAHAEAWLSVIDARLGSRKRVADARDFVARFAACACHRSTPHIYLSALPFCERTSSVYTQYQGLFKGQIDLSGTAISQRHRAARATWKTDSQVRSIAISHDGTRIVSGSQDAKVRVWDIRTGDVVAGPFVGHAEPVNSVAFSSDSEYVLSGSSDKTIRVWNARTGDMVIGPLKGHTGSVNSVAFSPDRTRIASGASDNTVRIWYTLTGDATGQPIVGHTGFVCSVAFSPDGARIVSGSADCTVRVWDACTGVIAAGPFTGHSNPVRSVAFSPEGTRIVSGSDDRTIRVWNANTGDVAVGPIQGHTGFIMSVAFSHDGTRVISGSGDETVRIWDPQTGDKIAEPLVGHTNQVNQVAFSPDATHIVSGSSDRTIRVWDAYSNSTKASEYEPLQTGHNHYIQSVAFSPDGSQVVSGSWDATVRVWDVHTGNLVVGPYKKHTRWVQSVTFSPDGGRIASGSFDQTICVWDARTVDVVAGPFRGHDDVVLSVAFSPDGALIASGSRDLTIRVWDARNGDPIVGPFIGHTKNVNTVLFTPDGSRIVSGSDDATIRTWNVRVGEAAAGLCNVHTDRVLSVAVSPDGTRIVSGSSDGVVCVWDAHTSDVVLSLFKRHPTLIKSVAFRPDGIHVISSSDDKTVIVWEASTGNIVARPSKIQGHTGSILSVASSPDGMYIVSGSEDQAIRVSSLDPLPTNQELLHQLRRHGMVSHTTNQTTTESGPSLNVTTGDPSLNITTPASNTFQSTAVMDFECHDDGWVMSNGIPLFWTPHDLRSVIPYPHDRVVMGYPGSLSIDYEHALFGERWTECYNAV